MIVFWILAAGLLGLALLFVVPPLVKGENRGADMDQDELNLALFRQQLAELDADLAAGRLEESRYEAARHDLERELLYDIDPNAPQRTPRPGGRWMGAVLAVLVPIGAVGLYLQLGETEIIPRLQARAGGDAVHAGSGAELPPLAELVDRLAARLAADPGDVEGWLMLGRSYYAIERPEQALKAFERAYALEPENVEVLLAYAQGLAAENGGDLAGRPGELIAQVLERDPDNINALWLEGMRAFQGREFESAVRTWELILPRLEPNGDEAAELRQFIAEARDRAQPFAPSGSESAATNQPGEALVEPSTAGSPATSTPTDDRSLGQLVVTVDLDESLWYQAGAEETLFVYAKAVAGPPMPLAVARAQVQDLPLTITLDDSLAMTPELRLSSFSQVLVGARISESGLATPQSGDLEGEVGPVNPGQDERVTLVIDRERP